MSVPSAIAPFRRRAWIPIVLDGDGDVSASKFSGTAWLSQSEQWPHCPNCSQPMQLFLQLDLNKLPQPASSEFGDGLLQMFYCTSAEPLCEVDCQAFLPFSESVLLRIVALVGEPNTNTLPNIEKPFPPKLIVDWKEVDDYPSWEESKGLGIELADPQWEALEESGSTHPGDKLAGWPCWVQGVEYPDCPTCGAQMRLVFQIDSEDNLPYMFGDAGCGHITQCRTHKSQLAFGWACG